MKLQTFPFLALEWSNSLCEEGLRQFQDIFDNLMRQHETKI